MEEKARKCAWTLNLLDRNTVALVFHLISKSFRIASTNKKKNRNIPPSSCYDVNYLVHSITKCYWLTCTGPCWTHPFHCAERRAAKKYFFTCSFLVFLSVLLSFWKPYRQTLLDRNKKMTAHPIWREPGLRPRGGGWAGSPRGSGAHRCTWMASDSKKSGSEEQVEQSHFHSLNSSLQIIRVEWIRHLQCSECTQRTDLVELRTIHYPTHPSCVDTGEKGAGRIDGLRLQPRDRIELRHSYLGKLFRRSNIVHSCSQPCLKQFAGN